MADAPRYPLEASCRLSRSLLWRLQRRFFERRGIAAWGDGVVPHYVTSNPYLAQAYGQIVLGFLRDWHAHLDPSQPLYLVELGAGSGRLAFHVLRDLDRRLTRSVFRDTPVCYVMTDFAEPNLAAWRAHPSLRPWLDAGRLDLARFDAECDSTLALERAGATLAPGTVRNPVIVIANYVFDGLPLDCFSVRDGHLHEWLVSLGSSRPEPDLDDPDILARAQLGYEQRRLDPDDPGGGYPGDPKFARILEEHRARLPDTAFTFPSVALDCLSRLSRLAGGRLLVLSTDKGEVREEALRGQTGPDITVHGSFSIAVNYHAIARFVGHQGGEALVPPERTHNVATCAFLLGAPPSGYVETRQAYAEAIEVRGPDDFFSLKQGMERAYATLTLDQLSAYLRFTGDDPKILTECLPALMSRVGTASADERSELLRALGRAWDGYFHIGEAHDLGFSLGLLASAMEAWPEAAGFFEGSLRWYGRDAGTLFNLAMCHHQLGQHAAALARLDEALAIDPACTPAIALRASLTATGGPP
jgi:hypothetical protein